jgi:hypothetical protein
MPPLLLNEHAIITQFLPGLLRSTDQFLFPSITIAKSHSRPKYNVVQRSPLLSLGRRVLESLTSRLRSSISFHTDLSFAEEIEQCAYS